MMQVQPLIQRLRQLIKASRSDITLQNSLFLMLSTVLMAGSGFLFWLIGARFYSPTQIGLASTLITINTTAAMFALLGFDNVVIRYLPGARDRNQLINTSITTTTLAAALLGAGCLAILPILSPSLSQVVTSPLHQLLFIAAIIVTTFDRLKDNIFISLRSTKYVLFANIGLAAAKVALPAVLATQGSYGLFLAFVLATTVAVTTSLGFLIRRYGYYPRPHINNHIFRQVKQFTLGTYASSLTTAVPYMALPVIITNAQGGEQAAYFNLANAVAALLYIVPIATASSLLADGAHHPGEFKTHTVRVAGQTLAIMLPLGLALFAGAGAVLNIFGAAYASGAEETLEILVLAGLGLAVGNMAQTVLKLHHRLRAMFAVQLAGALVMLVGGLVLAGRFGAVGGAWAFLAGQAVMAVCYLMIATPLLHQPIPKTTT